MITVSAISASYEGFKLKQSKIEVGIDGQGGAMRNTGNSDGATPSWSKSLTLQVNDQANKSLKLKVVGFRNGAKVQGNVHVTSPLSSLSNELQEHEVPLSVDGAYWITAGSIRFTTKYTPPATEENKQAQATTAQPVIIPKWNQEEEKK